MGPELIRRTQRQNWYKPRIFVDDLKALLMILSLRMMLRQDGYKLAIRGTAD